MKEKILTVTIVGLIVLSSVISISFNLAKAQSFSNESEEEIILQEIAETQNKTLTIDKIIGERYVKYWEHIIDDVSVKNDSILLHLDPKTGDILEYKKTWTDVKLSSLDFKEDVFGHHNYVWKKKVVFPDKEDGGIYYTFYDPVEYPVVCWEVRYTDGTTILYSSLGNEIGYGVPTPSHGCTLRGYGDTLWKYWRDNAKKWFDKWCSSVYSEERPTVDQISYYISRPQVEYFYVIAHSGDQSNRFSANDEGVYYYADQLHEDMLKRNPMNLAVLCCCSAMDNTGPGMLSYEFRKGEMTDTVTIGYTNMGECECWPYSSIPWQDFMFEKMNDTANYTMKEAFDLACAQYPCLADYVKFVGDETLRVIKTPPETYIYVHGPCGKYIGPYTLPDPPTPNKQDLELEGKVGIKYTFKATAPITHPSWPDTNDPTLDGEIAEYQWKRTGSNAHVNAESQQMIGQRQIQNHGISPVVSLDEDFIQGCKIEPISFSWGEAGTYTVTLTVKNDGGATSSTTITMHINRIFVDEQNEEQLQTKYLTR